MQRNSFQLHHQTPSVLMALCVPFPRCVENTIAPFLQDLKQDLEERAPFVLFDYNLYSVSDEAHHCLENFEDHSRLPWNWMFMPGETQHQPNLCTGHKWAKTVCIPSVFSPTALHRAYTHFQCQECREAWWYPALPRAKMPTG